MSEERIPKRSEVPEQFKWALEDIYATDEKWAEDLQKLKAMPERIAAFKGRLSESADTLYDFMQLSDEISVLCDSLGNYAQRRSDEDTANAKYQGFIGQLMNAYVAVNSAGSFETPEIISIEEDKLQKFYEDKPELKLYKRALDKLRRKKAHILSEAEEKILALTGEIGQSPENIYSMFSDADLRFPDAVDKDGKAHQVTHGSYIPLVQSEDRVLRKSAFESMYGTFDKFRNTCAATLSAQIKAVNFYAKARRYDSSLEAALDGTEVPVSVYKNLIEAVHDNMHYMYDYVALRKKLLGVDQLHFYDLYTPVVPDADMKITFEEAKETVLKALAPMGEDYLAILKEGFENRWIDVYENEGKRSGAYSAGARVHPYVLLNYTGTLDSEFTLAHEMGHAIHSYLSNKTQPIVYSDYVIFVAEVASTCNEALLMQHLLKTTTDKKQRAYLINHFLEQFRTTLYRQTMFAEFELKIAELSAQGVTLTADVLCEEYRKLNALYYGEDVVLDEEIALEWARIPHFYYNYYVFQYATGYAAAIALSEGILKDGEPAVERYLGFLSGGCSKSPIELLKGAGVDMTTAEPVNQALAMFSKLLDEMEALTA
mgnify:CR=1 FL=1